MARLFPVSLLLILPVAVGATDLIDLQFSDQVCIEAPGMGSKFGEGMAAGDFDGDGIDDLAVGGPAFGTTEHPKSGIVLVYFGNENRASQRGTSEISADITILGSAERYAFGKRLRSGDLDGDGKDELIVGNMYGDGPEGGRDDCGDVCVFFGRSREEFPDRIDLAMTAADLRITGADTKDYLGGELAVGDVNGDKKDDLVIGAFYGDGPDEDRYHAGEAFVVYGRKRDQFPPILDMATEKDVPVIYGAEATDTYGRSVAVGDVNGDGKADILIGAYYGDGPDNQRINAGDTYLIMGASKNDFPPITDLATAETTIIHGATDGDVSGRSVSIADLDGDGFGDVIIGAHQASPDPENDETNDAGKVYIFFGGKGRFSARMDLRTDADAVLVGMDRLENLGWPISSGRLSRGDKRESLLLLAKRASGGEAARINAGMAYLVPGRARSEWPRTAPVADFSLVRVLGADGGDKTAFEAILLDWNGDGVCEIGLGVRDSAGPENRRVTTGEATIVFWKD